MPARSCIRRSTTLERVDIAGKGQSANSGRRAVGVAPNESETVNRKDATIPRRSKKIEHMAAKANIDEIFLAALEKAATGKIRVPRSGVCRRRRIAPPGGEAASRPRQLGDFLESPAPEVAATFVPPSAEPVGTVIGPYKLLEQIGEGSFGIVYMADQQAPVRRRVR